MLIHSVLAILLAIYLIKDSINDKSSFKIVVEDPKYLPTRMTKGSVGYDCVASSSVILQPNTCSKVPLGFKIELPFGIEGTIRPRSGLTSKLVLCNHGTIDSDYRGTVNALLFNLSETPYEVKEGDRIAQLVFSEHLIPELIISDELSDTERGTKGFGSTGYRDYSANTQ
jgi:dUTP pyrophosphatase